MKQYFIAGIKINDSTEYQKYLDKVDEVCEKYNAEYLAVDNSPILLEGNWNYTKLVLIRFNSRKEFENWYHSDDYQEILKHRLASADCDSILVEGMK